jgi:mannan endo-1,4-beta-mannosidase
VPVILRPLHEMNCASFWWSFRNRTMTPDRYRTLWQQTFTYLTDVKGLDNLLFAFTPHLDNMDGRDAASWYPGDAYVDMVGMDAYKASFSSTNVTKIVNLHKAIPSKPFVLGEVGPDRSISTAWDLTILRDGLRDKFPFVSYFMAWSGPWYGMENHRNPGTLLNDQLVVNRSEIQL